MSVFESLLNNTFEVLRKDLASDGQGGFVTAYVELPDVLGRIRPATSTEKTVAQAEEQEISHVLYLVAGEDIARGDLVVSGDLSVEVLGIREPSLAGEHWEIDCRERQKGTIEAAGTPEGS